MTMGFDQIFNLSNAATKDVAEVLDMYIYRITFQSAADFSFSTAVSLFRSIINMSLLLSANRLAKMMGGSGLIG
jgi:putative aldouronate transport system permease protein